MTLLSFSGRHHLKRIILKNLTKNSFNKQKILLLSLINRFLDRGQIYPPLQIGYKNSPVDMGLKPTRQQKFQTLYTDNFFHC